MSAPKNLDHVVVATTDLTQTVKEFTEATGVAPQPGGIHPDQGTRNYLVTFGGDAYLEIIGPDPDSGREALPTVFGIDKIDGAKVATFAVHPEDIEGAGQAAHALGHAVGAVGGGQRRDPAGTLLQWRLTQPLASELSGVVPFLIDWGSTPLPAHTVEAKAELSALIVTHPEPQRIAAVYEALGTDAQVTQDARGAIHVTITGPAGSWSL